MHPLIGKLLQKRGITDSNQLSKEEKQDLDRYELTLNKSELNTSDIAAFIRSQISVIEGKWKDLETPNAKKADLIPYHVVYKTLLAAIDSPKAARESLEMYLNQLINQ